MDDEDDPKGLWHLAWGDLGAIALACGLSIFTLGLIVYMLVGGHPLAGLMPKAADAAQPSGRPLPMVSAPMHLAPGEVELSTGVAQPPVYIDDRPFPPIQGMASLKMTLRRTRCLGTCPDYSVQISGNGAVTYEGNDCVAQKGERTGHVSPAQVVALLQQFRNVRFFSLRDRFASSVTDMPTTTLTLSFDGNGKTVIDYAGRMDGMPPALSAIEDAIDKAAGSDAWINGGKRSCRGQPVDDTSGSNTH